MTDMAIEPSARELTRLQLLHAKLLRHARLTCGHSIAELEVSADGRGSYCKACVENFAVGPELDHQLLAHIQAIRNELRRPARTLEGMPVTWLAQQIELAAGTLDGVARFAPPGEDRTFTLRTQAITIAALAFLISREIEGGRT